MIETLTETLRSPWAIWLACVFCGIGVPVPEEALGMWAGLQASAFGGPVQAWLAAGSGFLLRDTIAWGLGRLFGERLIDAATSRRLLPVAKVEAARSMLQERGGRAVLIGRVMIGMRAITFMVAGAGGIPFRTFVYYDFIGLCATTGVLVTLGRWFGPSLLAWTGGMLSGPVVGFAIGLVVFGAWWRQRAQRRRAASADEG